MTKAELSASLAAYEQKTEELFRQLEVAVERNPDILRIVDMSVMIADMHADKLRDQGKPMDAIIHNLALAGWALMLERLLRRR